MTVGFTEGIVKTVVTLLSLPCPSITAMWSFVFRDLYTK